MRREDPTTARKEETHPNVEPATMTSMRAWEQQQQQQTQLEVMHERITEVLLATVNQETNTELRRSPHSTEKAYRKFWESISLPPQPQKTGI